MQPPLKNAYKKTLFFLRCDCSLPSTTKQENVILGKERNVTKQNKKMLSVVVETKMPSSSCPYASLSPSTFAEKEMLFLISENVIGGAKETVSRGGPEREPQLRSSQPSARERRLEAFLLC